MLEKKGGREVRNYYRGSLENKYFDPLKKEAARQERTLSSLISMILKKYCREKYGEKI